MLGKFLGAGTTFQEYFILVLETFPWQITPPNENEWAQQYLQHCHDVLETAPPMENNIRYMGQG